MYAVIRRYTGVSKLMDELEAKRDDMATVLGGAPGFVAYYAVRQQDGSMTTVSICDAKDGAEETTRRAATWVRDNLPAQHVRNPEVTGGEVFVHIGK